MTNVPGERRTDTATRVIAASPQAIYRAFLDPAAWETWLPPDGMTGHVFLFEPRPGGAYRMELTYRADGRPARGKTSDDTDVVAGRFLEIVPDTRVVHLVTFKSDDPAFAGTMKMTWRLAPVPGGTEVTIVCEDVPPGISRDDHATGLRSTLRNLAIFLETN
jgi:uncharacterized protein YndB with AHSA1/START domain